MRKAQGGKEVDEATQRLIAELYQKTRMSVGAIAAALEVSPGTVNKYKKMWLSQQRFK